MPVIVRVLEEFKPQISSLSGGDKEGSNRQGCLGGANMWSLMSDRHRNDGTNCICFLLGFLGV